MSEPSNDAPGDPYADLEAEQLEERPRLERPRGGPRQTQSYLQELLAANGLRPRRQYGQNFLIDLNLLDRLVEAAQILPCDVVLEVGAGTGGLTSRLVSVAHHVVSVEIDPGLYRLVQHETATANNLTLLHTDALAGKNRIQPSVIDAVRDAIDRAGQREFHLVANLPYDVAASVIGNLLIEPEPFLRSLTVTMQLEMAERIVAAPGSKDYGPLSVLIQRVGRTTWVRNLPPAAFWPRPKVQSTILRVEIPDNRLIRDPQFKPWYRFVRQLFMHRRKTLKSAIASIPGYKELRPQLDDVLVTAELDPGLRAETLAVDQMVKLYSALAPLLAARPADNLQDESSA